MISTVIQIVLLVLFAIMVILTLRSYFRFNNPDIDQDDKPTASGVKFLSTLCAIIAAIFAILKLLVF